MPRKFLWSVFVSVLRHCEKFRHCESVVKLAKQSHVRLPRHSLHSFLAMTLIFSLLFNLTAYYLLPTTAYAATSPWTQTDWFGGSGQTAWSDTTKFDSSSSVTTSTANQVTLTATSSWYNTSWAYRKKITFNNSAQAENLTNFPVLVKLSSSNFDFTKAQSAGQDIRFTDSDGTTTLSYEIEQYSNSSSTANIWVKVPQIDASSATDNIYIYYGNSSATDSQAATSVWDSNFKAVYHMGASSGTTLADSTSNNTYTTKIASGRPAYTASGQINGAQVFTQSTSDYTANSHTLLSSGLSFEAWVKTSSTDNTAISATNVALSVVGDTNVAVWQTFGVHGGKIRYNHYDDINNWANPLDSTNSVNDNSWHLIAVTHNSSTGAVVIYKDGIADGSGTITYNTANTAWDRIGATYQNTDFFDGAIDEVRVSNTPRSASWIAADYKTENDTFNTFASEEPQVQTSGTLTSSIFDTGQGNTWGTLTYSATTPTNTAVSVKVRTSNSSTMSGATDFASCSAISSGTDISSNSCVTENHRYIQYLVTLSNTNYISTSTFSDISISFTDSDIPTAAELISPDNNSYTNNERPTFKWKAVTDVGNSGLSSYTLEIDNGSTGDFSITSISPTPPSGPNPNSVIVTTNKYVITYENFNDADSTNNYISVYTKSTTSGQSDGWSTNQNDGKLTEGRRTWTVKATDSEGNQVASSRTLFVDFTRPNLEEVKVNNTTCHPERSVNAVEGSSSVNTTCTISTTDHTPTITGKLTDPLAGEIAQGQTQTESGPQVASGPKEVTIKLEKKTGLIYSLHTSYTINMDTSWWSCDGKEITDNSKNNCNKYAPFTYTVKDNLDIGTYRVTITGKDKANNPAPVGAGQVLILNISTLAQITTPEEQALIDSEILKQVQDDNLTPDEANQVKEGLEVTKPVEQVPQSPLSVIPDLIGNLYRFSTSGLFTFVGMTRDVISFLFNIIGNTLAFFFNINTQVLAFVRTTLATIFNTTLQLTSSVLTFISNRYIHSLTTAFNFFSTTTNTIASLIGTTYNQLANNAPGVIRTVLLAVGDGVSTFSTIIGNGISAAANLIGTIAHATGSVIVNVSEAISNSIRIASVSVYGGFLALTNGVRNTATSLAFGVGERVQKVSDVVGLGIIKFTYNFVSEPTTISDVHEEIISATSVKISWKTNHPASGKVNYGFSPGNYDFEQQTNKRSNHHEFILTGLQPDTQYHFEVMSQNKNYVYDANRTFITPKE